jgi:hypothetical protein
MIKRVFLPLAFLGLCLVTQPRQAQAIVVTAVECTVVVFPCPAINVVDAGFRANGVGVLGANRFTVLPFSFTNLDVTFNGTLLATDLAGQNIYIWGGGTATNLAGVNFYLDVQISQNYLTAPGVGLFSEFNVGNCTPNAVGTNSGVAAVLGVNGIAVGPVMGSSGPIFGGDCAPAGGPGGNPGFNFVGGPTAVAIGGITNMTALAQFYFDGAGGPLPQSIDLPWGEDFPNVDLGIPTPDTINTFDVTDQSPEPGTITMIGGALCMAAFGFRKRKR